MATQVTGDLYVELDGKLAEIKRQMRQPSGYPFDPEKLNKFLQRAIEGEFDDGQRWHEQDGVIYLKFEVISRGTTGPEWINRLEKKGCKLSKLAKDVLNSPDFNPTRGVIYKIAILKGKLFTDSDRVTGKIQAEADRRKFKKLQAEGACLIRELISDEEMEAMDLWRIVVFHKPIKDSDGDPSLLYVDRDGGGQRLGTYSDRPDAYWVPGYGFAFVVSQVSSN